MGFKEALDLIRKRRVRLFADRCTADISDEGTREEFRRRFRERFCEMDHEGMRVRLDPRFLFRAGPEDMNRERLDFILRGFNGLAYLDDIRFMPGLERKLMGSYQREGAAFHGKRLPGRPPISIRLIDTCIGFGVFADRDIAVGECLGEYGGIVSVTEDVIDRMYCYEYPVLKTGGEEVVLTLDAGKAGNETRFINHARMEMVAHNFEFFSGHWHTVFTVHSPIAGGNQILIDYGNLYWEGKTVPPESLSP